MAPWHLPRAVESVGKRCVQDRVDEGRLAGAGDPGHGSEYPQRETDVDVLKIVFAGPNHRHRLAEIRGPPGVGQRDGPLTGNVLARDRSLVFEERGEGPGVDHLSPVLTRSRANIDHPIGGANGVFVVLNDDERIA